jgi:AP2-associated kinase
MLRESPQARPTIYQVLKEGCRMRGVECPIKDVGLDSSDSENLAHDMQIYAGRTASEGRRNQKLPITPSAVSSPPVIGVTKVAPVVQKTVIPDIAPMRRGRPTNAQSAHNSARPSPSPLREKSSDPWAALDSSNQQGARDELSSKFPTLDEFSLLHEKGSKFEFDEGSLDTVKPVRRDLTQRVIEKLADDAFAQPAVTGKKNVPSTSVPTPNLVTTHIPSQPRTSDAGLKTAEFPGVSGVYRPTQNLHQPTPTRPSTYADTGTMTSPSPTPPQIRKSEYPGKSSGEFGRSPPGVFEVPEELPPRKTPDPSLHHKRPSFLGQHRSQSSVNLANSSRPSLEGSRPTTLEISSTSPRSKSASGRQRPTSAAYVDSDMAFLRDLDRPGSGRASIDINRSQYPTASTLPLSRAVSANESGDEEGNIESEVGYLRAKEDEENARRREKRSSSGSKHSKRTSLPSISISNTKTIMKGKFGAAFSRFEASGSGGDRSTSPPAERKRGDLTPIAGSEQTDNRSEDGYDEDEATEMSGEQRRELERKRLEQEESRVEAAAAEYRKRIADREKNGPSNSNANAAGLTRAATIQNKVRSLQNDTSKPPARKTAEGYGKYTDTSPRMPTAKNFESPRQGYGVTPPSVSNRKPVPAVRQQELPPSSAFQPSSDLSFSKTRKNLPAQQQNSRTGPPKPAVKPQNLQGSRTGAPSSPTKPSTSIGRQPYSQSTPVSRVTTNVAAAELGYSDDLETDFSKRYPSLSGLEMVETEIEDRTSRGLGIRSKEL